MSESAKEVFARIPEARREAAVREADERCRGVYACAHAERAGNIDERACAAYAAEDAARATVFARFAEPVAKTRLEELDEVFRRITSSRRADAECAADKAGNAAWATAFKVPGTPNTVAEQAEHEARLAVFRSFAEPAAPLASSHGIFLRIPEANRDAARAEANEAGNKAWSNTYDATNCDCDAAAKAEEVARWKVLSRYVEVAPPTVDIFAAVKANHEAAAAFVGKPPPKCHADRGWLISEVERLSAELVIEADAAKMLLCHADSVEEVLRAKLSAAQSELARVRTELSTANEARTADGLSRMRAELLKAQSAAAPLSDASRAMLTEALAGAEEKLRLAHGTERYQDAYAAAFGGLSQAVHMVLESSESAVPSPAWERLRSVAGRVVGAIADCHGCAPEAIELRAALDAVAGKPAPAVDAPKLGRDTFEPKPRDIECECLSVGPRTSAADHDDACPVYLSHAAKPSDAWSRVVHVEGRGYDTSVLICGREWSPCQCDAIRWSRKAARARANMFRESGSVARVIRLRPRAK